MTRRILELTLHPRRLGEFGETVSWREFLVLLLSLEGESVLEAVQLLFEVFSDEGDCSLSHVRHPPSDPECAQRERDGRGQAGVPHNYPARSTARLPGRNIQR